MKSDSKIRQFCCKQIFLCYNGVGEIFMEFESIAKVSIEALNDYIAEGHVYEIMIKDPECYPRGKSYDVFALLTMKRAMAEFLKGCPARNSNDPNNEINIRNQVAECLQLITFKQLQVLVGHYWKTPTLQKFLETC